MITYRIVLLLSFVFFTAYYGYQFVVAKGRAEAAFAFAVFLMDGFFTIKMFLELKALI